ncbi:glycosyltransferase family 4 protein [Desulfatiglans anilini]|uniref:glycosyltransferase family 4 protein n=1 Tax=Desulfatiglans anilini TaxID=90728 RepID=UPI0009FD6D27|nr:MraY family glycosyltransferase [Desulfatiglans anilini]
MTTITVIFLIALTLALVNTPLVAKVGLRLGIVDPPGERKIHRRPVPRIGGAAIFLSFWGSFLPVLSPWVREKTNVLQLIASEPALFAIALGSAIAFGLGLWDDKRGLGPWKKFGVQILAGAIAYFGGVQIQGVSVPGVGTFHLGWVALPVTVFWILLVMNAINLIDGLDGLAAGVSFFACMVLVALSVIGHHLLVAALMAALAGAILGFLRYNFNPAKIFMGDGGSYFLGYMIATSSIIGSIKGQAAVTLLIPVIAMGVPLLDTMWATVRRFLMGKAIFQADREHFHHRLLRLGYSHRKAVLLLYGASIMFGILALALVNLQDERAALILGAIAVVVILGIRRLGYMNYLKGKRLMAWIRELGDAAGLSHERRSFLYEQIQISEASDLEELWRRTAHALGMLEIDLAALYLNGNKNGNKKGGGKKEGRPFEMRAPQGAGCLMFGPGNMDRRLTAALHASVCSRIDPPDFVWSRTPLSDIRQRYQLRLELALIGEESENLGTLVLLKNGGSGATSHYTLKRVEHLRRNVIGTLENILGKEGVRMNGNVPLLGYKARSEHV